MKIARAELPVDGIDIFEEAHQVLCNQQSAFTNA